MGGAVEERLGVVLMGSEWAARVLRLSGTRRARNSEQLSRAGSDCWLLLHLRGEQPCTLV